MWSGAVSCRALLGHEIETAPTPAGRATDIRGVNDHLIDYYAFEAVRIQNVGVRIGRVDPSAKPVIDALDELQAWSAGGRARYWPGRWVRLTPVSSHLRGPLAARTPVSSHVAVLSASTLCTGAAPSERELPWASLNLILTT